MVNYTRRSHIVRISDAGKDDKPEESNYIDVEVLDAIAFRIEGGKEVILKTSGGKAYIDDQTDGGNGKKPGNASRRSHIKRLKGGKDAELDVETIEAAAFTDQNGGEWILNMKDPGSVVDTEDGGGGSTSTRRGHTEKITDPFGGTKDAKSYVKMQRHDMIAFRRANGEEVILKAPSNDDPNSHDPRASTFLVSPKEYDPKNDEQKVPKNEDENVYFAFVKDKSGGSDGDIKPFLIGDTKIVTGPLWWIRKVHSKGGIIYGIVGLGDGVTATITTNAYSGSFDLGGDIKLLAPGQTTTPSVEDPVTGEMMSSLLQWTPKPPYKNVTTDEIWFIDKATWAGVFQHHFTFQAAYGTQEEARLAMAQALYDAFGVGQPPDFPENGAAYVDNAFNDLPGPPDPRFFAIPGNTAHSETQTHTSTTAVFALNINLLISQLPKDATELTFTITFNRDGGGFQALAYPTNKKFPLDSKNMPLFTPVPKDGGGGRGEVVGHLQLKDNKELKITYTGGRGPG